MKSKLTIMVSPELHQQISGLAKVRHLSVSAVFRLAALDYLEKHKPELPAPSKPTPDDDVVGVDGYTKAQRAAILARAKQRVETSRDAFTAERPRELSPIRSFDEIELEPIDVPTKPNIVMGEAERQRIADEWSADEY